MRILLINYRYFISGGPERYLFNVKEMLEQEGHEVIPFSVKSKRNVSTEYEKYFAEPMGGQDEAYFDNAKRTPKFALDVISRLFYSFHVKRRLKKLIDDTQPDVAYILHHYNKLSPSVIDACKDKGLKVYVRLSDFFLLCPQAHFLRHGTVCERCLENGLHEAVSGRCVKNSVIGSTLKASSLYLHTKIMKCYTRVDGFVCTTKFMKERMQKAGWSGSRLHVVPTFMSDNEAINRVESPRIADKYILYFGRFAHEKGLDLLVNAYFDSSLPSQGIKLVLVGGVMHELENLIGRSLVDMGLDKDVRVINFIQSDGLSPLIRNAMFIVVPSRWYENMPNTVLEAYSYGKPVVAMNIGSMPEIVQDGVTGLLFENESASDLSQKLNVLIHDNETLQGLMDGVGFAKEKYAKSRHYESLINIFIDNCEYD